MDNIRLMLIIALGGVLFMLYSAWVEDYGQLSAPPMAIESEFPEMERAENLTLDVPAPSMVENERLNVAQQNAQNAVTVTTDLFTADISLRGGAIQNLWLHQYAKRADAPEDQFQLLKAAPPNLFIVQSGLRANPQELLPTQQSLFSAQQPNYQLAEDDDSLNVELRWQHDSGVEVIKRYRFERNSYVVHERQEIRNHSDQPLAVRTYHKLQRTDFNDPNKTGFASTYTGGVYFGPDVKYNKESFKDMKKHALELTITDGWVAMMQHYFMAAWIAPEGKAHTFYTRVLDRDSPEPRYIIGHYSPAVAIAPGATHAFDNRLFVGPKLQNVITKVAPGLHLAIDYGWLTIIAEPIFWLMNAIHSLVGNWGWSIIILTILIKLAFYKLSETSYKSMAAMRKLTPRMKALKDRYGDDKERLNQAMMELYQSEKINPLGGCLPILLQIPVFIALYWVLLESVELRHAPFILWLDNLTAPDPYYVLPLIMGVSMFVQQKLNPPPPDPIQEKIITTLPVVFTIFFAFFPSGLVLYWTVNNLLSIAQQWYITRQIEQEGSHKPKLKKG